MAQAQATPQDANAAPAKKSKKLLIVVLILIAVLLLAGAGVVGLLLLKKSAAANDAAQGDAPTQTTGVDLSRPPTFVTLEPFVVNLAPGEGDRYLQAVIALRVADSRTGEAMKGFMPEIRHRINLLLTGKLASELSSPDGRADLALEIADEINGVLGVQPGRRGGDATGVMPVHSVLFNSFIIQ